MGFFKNIRRANDYEDTPLNDPFAEDPIDKLRNPFLPLQEDGPPGGGTKEMTYTQRFLPTTDAEILSQGTDYNNWYDYLNPKKWGESFYNLTQPGNPDPWQLAKEIGPIYRDKLPSLFANPSELERDFPGSVPNLKEPNPLLDRLNESLGDGQYNQSEVLRKSKNPSINYEGLYEDPHRFLKTADKFDRTGQSDNWWSGEIPVNARARADNRAYNRDRPLPSPYGERSYYFDEFNPRVGTPELTAEEQLDMGLLPDPFGGYGFKDGGRVRFANGGLASLFTRRG